MYERKSGRIRHAKFGDLSELLPECAIVFNDTKVIKARIYGRKLNGTECELFFHKALSEFEFLAQIKGRVKVGEILNFSHNVSAEILALNADGTRKVRFFKAEIKGENALSQNLPNSSENSQQNSPQKPSPKDLKSIGFNIFLPFEQKGNDFLGYNITFKSLAIRKMALVEKSLAFVIFPGGFGTLDEFVEVLTLKQLGFKDVPIFVVGREFWRGFDEFIKSSLLSLNVISKGDELKYEITDDLEFIVKKLKEEYENSSRNEWRG